MEPFPDIQNPRIKAHICKQQPVRPVGAWSLSALQHANALATDCNKEAGLGRNPLMVLVLAANAEHASFLSYTHWSVA